MLDESGKTKPSEVAANSTFVFPALHLRHQRSQLHICHRPTNLINLTSEIIKHFSTCPEGKKNKQIKHARKKGQPPKVSLHLAISALFSCATAGKKLCTQAQWSAPQIHLLFAGNLWAKTRARRDPIERRRILYSEQGLEALQQMEHAVTEEDKKKY